MSAGDISRLVVILLFFLVSSCAGRPDDVKPLKLLGSNSQDRVASCPSGGSQEPGRLDEAAKLNSQAGSFVAAGDYAKAEPLYKKALEIRETELGPAHPEVASILNNLAALYYSFGDYNSAEPLYRRALEIQQKVLGPAHPDVAASINNLAALCCSAGDFAQAEALHKRSLEIHEKALGPEHPKVAASLNNLALVYYSVGDYAKAEPLFKKALAVREKVLGQAHPEVATSLNNLALLYYSLGNYAEAEPLFRKALAIREKALGPAHPEVAASLNNLAALYEPLGDYAKAEPLYKKSLAINEKTLGPEHPEVATSLNNLAELYYSLDDYAKAEPLYKRSLAIHEKNLGPEHPRVATSLNNLALLYCSLCDYVQAELFLNRALEIRKKAFGPEHPEVATSFNNLALLYSALGNDAQAEPLFKRSLEIREKTLGPEHPDVATSLNNLALLYGLQGDCQKAYDIMMRAQKIEDYIVQQVIGLTSEDEKINFISTHNEPLYALLSLAAQYQAKGNQIRKGAFDIWLRRKGMVLEVQKKFQESLVCSDDPSIKGMFNDLTRIRSRLARLVFAGPGRMSIDAYKKQIAELEGKKQDLEAQLTKLSRAFARNEKVSRADTEKVAGALPHKSVLVEFARIDLYDFHAREIEARWGPPHYLAFILPAGNADRLSVVDLGKAEEIDKAIGELTKSLDKYSQDPAGVAIAKAASKAFDLIFNPLQKGLGDTKEIFLSPDGSLDLIPFEILRRPNGRYLIEDYTFNYLNAGRDLLGFDSIQEPGGKTLLIGDPDFDLGEKDKSIVMSKLGLKRAESDVPPLRVAALTSLSFNRLPGTKQEVEAIHELIGQDKSELYIGREALEDVLKCHESPRIIHFATHGFFLDAQNLPKVKPSRGKTPISGRATPAQSAAYKRSYENPLTRSGLMLAGANRAMRSGVIGQGDGIVTADKILELRLKGTEMVVLSACKTGLGEIRNGEGVLGLRRAFLQAGAGSLVMSMWSVPDQETRELMIEFYKNALSGKINRCQALRQAAIKEMQIVKERYGGAHPAYWGAFVFLGKP